ncbi:hypothetical protein NDU88_001854 [Pleurodeles waltl]|uniref:Uncharacterized protein n=1 Tax=Pleurodeles waltl TaxID=8319 RepID=A0AAV7VXP1_PLEWA|nr:hypothetical protein NDU88_001854 [Pleurodeles waltl]
MNPEIRVPEAVNVDEGEENIEEATEDAKKVEEKTDAGGKGREGRAGNSDIPTERTGPMRKDSSEETSTHRHVPGGAWLNKGIIASQEGNLGETTRETLQERNTLRHQFNNVKNS